MNMKCANENCIAELKYLRGGRLFLMERQPSSPPLAVPPYSMYCAKAPECVAFEPLPLAAPADDKPVVTMRRYFWLCESCSETYVIRRWAENGIELAPRAKRPQISTAALPREWMLPGLVG